MICNALYTWTVCHFESQKYNNLKNWLSKLQKWPGITPRPGICCPSLGLGAPSKGYPFSDGSALCKMKLTLPFQRWNSRHARDQKVMQVMYKLKLLRTMSYWWKGIKTVHFSYIVKINHACKGAKMHSLHKNQWQKWRICGMLINTMLTWAQFQKGVYRHGRKTCIKANCIS